MPVLQEAAPRREQRDMPLASRSAAVRTINTDSRTVDLVWTTGARVLRYDWWNDRPYLEELSLDPAHVRMGRLQSGAANLLNTHSSSDVSDVLGVVTGAQLDGGAGTATVRFSQRPDVQPVFQDVVDGIVRSVSVGYAIYKVERIAPAVDGDPWIYRVIDWEPYELSLVAVPADPGATTRADPSAGPRASGIQQRTFACEFIEQSNPPAAAGTRTREENTMPGDTTTQPAAQTPVSAPAQTTAPAVDERALQAAREEGARLEGERQVGIREAVRLGGLEPTFADQLIGERSMTADAAGLAVLREQARRSAATPTRSALGIETVSDETETRRQAMGDALRLRANPGVRLDAERAGAARQYRGMSLMDMAREAIEQAGGNVRGLSKREMAVMALNLDRDMQVRGGMQSTSDFPEILANTIGRTLRTAYEQQPRTFMPFCRPATAPDFKQIARTQLSESSAFQKVNEGGEYKLLTFGDTAEKYSLAKYGGIVAITWETLINDDLSAFDRVPLALAAEAAAIEGDVVYGILLGNPNMADGTALFDAGHGNLAGAGTAISETSLSAGRAAMLKQKGPKGRVLNIRPSYLVVGPDKEYEANKYTSANFVAAKAIDINPAYNTSLEVIVEARITGNKWHLAAAPGMVDTIEYAYLEGEEGLFTETRRGFEVDGLQIKARHVFAAKAIDWRGLYQNPGA
ncbi:prohead protease/major capsid protein fusion protein [Ralstonia pseudosolanacearum]|uniref:prohead protease/major capsid protein fusion protein n=1 Tax=Ralstonia pseudosolanacearum TaxID=1310165 RepID=UPI00267579A3|nr:prohead protease/major capsid protein fusion protein [Ralstonia pseudosolanacearum]MDO3524510.1 Mu-like prophage major head subunit gpT family protein [Ralstonia pseudosolanacearum]MDO3552410.1 Mu-like prophage major head subunit gpT family protein [Ralstonia pseudosolanacearum]MDO3591231.1 Mu-like prophage major head subunit gpT family protein [Ralstonia pseudosolanacearum]MDO3595721.1 Mu-like prophage major head subunit gpT family protein [Ralstonia pseudosolanacearum]MDO3601272.1 Mu-like